jgi:hypothetical protein
MIGQEAVKIYRVSIKSLILYKNNNLKPWIITANLFIIYETTMKKVYFNDFFFQIESGYSI